MVALDNLRQKRLRRTKAQLVEDLEKLERRVAAGGGLDAGAIVAGEAGGIDAFAPFFATVFKAVPDAALLVDPERRIVAGNPAFRRVFGFRPEEIQGRKTEFLHAGKRCERQIPMPFEPVRTDAHRPAEVVYRRANGQTFAGDTLETPIDGDNGGAIGYLVIIRELAADATQRETARLRRVIENLREGLAFYDADDRLIYCNEEYRRLHPAIGDLLIPGARFEDLVRAHAERGAIPDAGGREEDYVRERMERHRNPGAPVIRGLKDGTWFIIREGRTPDGGTYSITTDITQLKKTEAELLRNQKQFLDAVATLQEGFALYDADDRLVVCNEEYRRLHPVLLDILKPGMRFEDLVRLGVERGMNADAIGREEEHIRDRMERHFNPRGPIVRTLTNGTVFLIKESRTPDGGVVVTETDITERRRAEALSTRFGRIVERSLNEIYVFDGKTLRFIEVNHGARMNLGYSIEELRNITPLDLKPEYTRQSFAALIRPLLDGKEEKIVFETVHKRKDGTTYDVEVHLQYLPDEEPPIFAAIIQDITARKRADEALRRSEERLRGAIESLQEGFALFDADDRVVAINDRYRSVNPAAHEIMERGGTFEDMLRANIKRGFIVEAIGREEEFIRERVARHRHPKGPILRRMADGNWYLLKEVRTPEGGIALTFIDITGLLQAEEALKESEQRFKDFAEVASDWFWEMDENLRFTYFSGRNFEVTGYEDSTIIGKTRQEVTKEDTSGPHWRDHLAALERHEPFQEFYYDLATPDGNTLRICVNGMPIFDAAGDFKGYRGTGTDITERWRAEEALKESERRFRNLIEGSIQGILISGQTGMPLFANQALVTIFGYHSVGDLLGRENAAVLAAPYEVTRLNLMMAARFRGGAVPDVYEFDGIRKDGETIRVQATTRVLNWKGERAAQTTLIDVTERWQAQRARERLSQAVENVPVGIALFDSDDRLEFCNSRYREQMAIMADKLKRGTRFEDMLRAIVERAPVKDARGREEEYIRERLELHRNPSGPVDLRREDRWLRATETRLEDGSIFTIIADMTEHKQAEEALIASEKRLRGAIGSMQEGFALFDSDDRLVAVNEVYRRINPEAQAYLDRGTKFEEIVRNNLGKGRILEAVGREEEFIRDRMARHRDPKGPIIRQFSDGSWYILKETRTPDGGIALTFTDITELKRVETALRESEARFRDVAESAGDWFWEMGPDLRFTFLSQRFFELFPIKRAQIIGRTRDEFAGAPRTDGHWKRHLRDIAEHKPFRDFEYAVDGPEGRQRHIRISGKPRFDHQGVFRGYRGTGTDVTAEKEAAAAAARAQAHLYDAVESIDAGIALFDRSDRLVLCNSRYRGLHPVLPELARPGTPFRDLIAGAIRAGVYHRAMGTPEEITERRMRYHLNTPSSHEQHYADGRWLNVQEYSTHDGGRVLISTDITERRLLEKQLAGAQRMEALGKLTGGVAHDFNNLLTIVLGNLQLLEGRVGEDPKLKKYVQMSTGAAKRGAELTGRLLAFARRQMLETAVTDVNKLVFGMGALLRGILGETIPVDHALAEDLKSVRTDATQLENALINLVVNARDAMPEGGKLTIETRNVTLDRSYASQNPGASPGDFVMIAVTDTGVGMTPDVVDHAFEPFFTTKDIGKGTGLGLSMVYGFVKQSGGYIKIYSELGHGTVVKMYLPRATTDDEATAAGENDAEEAVGGRETVLVVEDDVEVRQTTVALLGELKYRVVEAEDGPSALKMLETLPDVDLLLTDVIMPGGMRGPDLAREVRKHRPRMKILYMSGYTEHVVLKNGLVEPNVPLLAKPFQRSELAAKVRAALDA